MNALSSLAHDSRIAPHLTAMTAIVDRRMESIFHRDKKGISLAAVLKDLPNVEPTHTDVNRARIRIGCPADLNADQLAALHEALVKLKPWRKGPFDIFGISLDSEWDSSIKWNRLAGHLPCLEGKRVLDIGSSCGYYMFRLAQRQPAMVIGLEPSLGMYFQYLALSRYLDLPGLHCLPLKLEEIPPMPDCFDMVLCMGILYHRRSPLDTLRLMRDLMTPGGQLVVETLILEDRGSLVLFPETRYARMKNVFFIPTVDCLTHWLRHSGFDDVRCVDISATTFKEQRKTDWIDGQSLSDFLDPDDPHKTVEGYPAPVRAMVMATAR
ncbi:MAG: tRNA 5-methoxyuridine(34)/uridine 5-oxyacetic acid(34) synthase CmoB [Proteobacteria bacterium]|nr:MAG: tRNA 5-methoxyuridine(34)/uridine 5-oxyacetic acid(34) synthase CmoB [Pseudomonadota bacterium]PIE68050.1 MAG: tRNA 5-methoxyuridine(34)/uridine 5-oxyacetic acid(34) synthase CmoB [Deltaproteobacteria bacterium]